MGRRPKDAALAIAPALVLVAWLIHLRASTSLASYPFLFPDSYDWIVNGLRYSGTHLAPFSISHRAMLLPLVIAGCFRLGIENSVVLFGTFAYLLTVVLAAVFLPRAMSRAGALVAIWLVTFSFTFLGQSAYLGADVAANLFLAAGLGCLYAFLSGGRTTWLIPAGAVFGLGMHTQYIGAILLPAILVATLLVERNGRLTITMARWPQLARDRRAAVALAAFVLAVLVPLVPRLLVFHVAYREYVQHWSLVHPHADGPAFYAWGLLAAFSWPVCLLAAVGAITGLAGRRRYLTACLLLWIADVLLFFAFLYTETDVRFLLYAGLPTYLLAAEGFCAVSRGLARLLPGGRAATGLAGALLVVVLIYDASPPTPDPFDLSIAITPHRVLTRSPEGRMELGPGAAVPYPLAHAREIREWRAQLATYTMDTSYVSQPLMDLFADLRGRWQPGVDKLVYLDFLQPEEWYYVRNRNILYVGADVSTVRSFRDLADVGPPAAGIILVTRRLYLDRLLATWPHREELAPPLAAEGPYVAQPVTAAQVGSILDRGGAMRDIRSVRAREAPEWLFDGITDDPTDFSASPLGEPIEVEFRRPENFAALAIHLWDFDGRTYRLEVRVRVGSRWTSLDEPGDAPLSGLVVVDLPDMGIDAIQIIGLENSDTRFNPANRILHIKEMELLRRPPGSSGPPGSAHTPE